MGAEVVKKWAVLQVKIDKCFPQTGKKGLYVATFTYNGKNGCAFDIPKRLQPGTPISVKIYNPEKLCGTYVEKSRKDTITQGSYTNRCGFYLQNGFLFGMQICFVRLWNKSCI